MDEEWNIMWERFLDVFVKTKGKSSYKVILQGLLTPTERVMLAKRVVAIFLILSDWDAATIAETINLSTSTVYNLKQLQEHNSEYRRYMAKLIPEKIPFSAFAKTSGSTSRLLKLLDNIYTGYTHRSRLRYG